MSRNRNHETSTMLRRPTSPGIAVPSAGVSFQPENLFFQTPSAIHCGVVSHNGKFWLVIESTSGCSATSRPAAGLRPLRSLGVPATVFAVTGRFVFFHRFRVARTPGRCLRTVPGTGFAFAPSPIPPSTPMSYEWF